MKHAEHCFRAKALVYILRDPITLEVRYVGSCQCERNRRCSHKKANATSGKGKYPAIERWKARLLRRGLTPIFEVVERCECDCQAHAREKELIAEYAGKCGARLLNRTHNPLWTTRVGNKRVVFIGERKQRLAG